MIKTNWLVPLPSVRSIHPQGKSLDLMFAPVCPRVTFYRWRANLSSNTTPICPKQVLLSFEAASSGLYFQPVGIKRVGMLNFWHASSFAVTLETAVGWLDYHQRSLVKDDPWLCRLSLPGSMSEVKAFLNQGPFHYKLAFVCSQEVLGHYESCGKTETKNTLIRLLAPSVPLETFVKPPKCVMYHAVNSSS